MTIFPVDHPGSTYLITTSWNISLNTSSSLFQCNSIIEEHDESIIDFFKKPSKNPKKGFCTDLIELCEDDGTEEEEDDDDGSKTEL